MRISETAVNFIIRFEGLDQPGIWPGDASGVSIGCGYDLGYEAHFEDDWRGLLSDDVMKRLRPTLGLKGSAAHHAALSLRDIRIPKDAARSVLENVTIPREEATTMKVFPGSETLPADAFGGLVSLIYNRGPLVDKSPRRKEMLALFQLFRKGAPFDLAAIAAQVEAQKRLWPHVGDSDGDLWTRRITEAKLIREASWDFPQSGTP